MYVMKIIRCNQRSGTSTKWTFWEVWIHSKFQWSTITGWVNTKLWLKQATLCLLSVTTKQHHDQRPPITEFNSQWGISSSKPTRWLESDVRAIPIQFIVTHGQLYHVTRQETTDWVKRERASNEEAEEALSVKGQDALHEKTNARKERRWQVHVWQRGRVKMCVKEEKKENV